MSRRFAPPTGGRGAPAAPALASLLALALLLALAPLLALATPPAAPAPPASPEAEQARALERLARSKRLESDGQDIEALWRRWFQLMNTYAKRHSAQDELPDPAWWRLTGDDKQTNLETLNDLSAQILSSLKGTRAQKLRDDYRALSQQIAQRKQEARALAHDSYLAPEEGDEWFYESSKQDYERLVRLKQEAVKALETERQERLQECHDAMIEMGMQLTEAQVRDMFQMERSGDGLLDLMITYTQLNLMLELITQRLNAEAPQDAYVEEHQRYYATYVAVVGLMIDIHAQTRQSIERQGISELAALESRIADQIEETTRLLRDEEALQRRDSAAKNPVILKGYQDNLKAQRDMIEGVREYKGVLAKQVKLIRQAEVELTRQFRFALNTYETISINQSYRDIIQRTTRELHNLSTLHLPQMIPLLPERLSTQLSEINGQLIKESQQR